MDRLIIQSIEGRITLGITMFVSLMILIGWVMINEPYRMAAFEEQHLGRSIEQGAELFAANCTGCHGTYGQGSGLAPALNSPHLFGHDFTASVRVNNPGSPIDGKGIGDLQREIRDDYASQLELMDEQQRLQDELSAPDITDEAAADLGLQLQLVQAKLNPDIEAVAAQLAELNAMESLDDQQTQMKAALESNIPTKVAIRLAELDGENGLIAQRQAILNQMSDAIENKGYYPRLAAMEAAVPSRDEALANSDEKARVEALLNWVKGELALSDYIASDANRLLQVAWGGDLRGYITTTLIHGRPGSNNVWAQPMVSWSQEGGGPLRRDQIDNIVNYILNFDKGDNWTLADLGTVNQFARLHADAADVNSEPAPPPEKPDISGLPTGDAANGELLYASNQCTACHLNGAVGPATAGTWARVASDRLTLPEFAGWTVEEYVYDSIIAPNAYVVANYPAGVMPQTFAQTLSDQDIADIMAYLATQ